MLYIAQIDTSVGSKRRLQDGHIREQLQWNTDQKVPRAALLEVTQAFRDHVVPSLTAYAVIVLASKMVHLAPHTIATANTVIIVLPKRETGKAKREKIRTAGIEPATLRSTV